MAETADFVTPGAAEAVEFAEGALFVAAGADRFSLEFDDFEALVVVLEEETLVSTSVDAEEATEGVGTALGFLCSTLMAGTAEGIDLRAGLSSFPSRSSS